MLSRPRQGDGNNLFGGRQKLYRVPAEGSSTSLGGRHLYQNDISAAMFHENPRTRKDSSEEGLRRNSSGARETEDSDQVNSPSTPFSKNRDTSSSTASRPSNGRTSTAATSVGPDSPAITQSTAMATPLSTISDHSAVSADEFNFAKRSNAKPDMQPPTFPTTSDSRSASQQSWRRPSTKSSQRLSQSRSATSLHDKYSLPTRTGITSAARNISPPLVHSPAKTSIPNSLREDGRSPSPRYRAASPTFGLAGDADSLSHLDGIVEPNDRGKATAMGIFTRPQRQFDEKQFSQRQLQMLEGRISPPTHHETNSRSDSRTSVEQSRSDEQSEPQVTPSTSPPDSSESIVLPPIATVQSRHRASNGESIHSSRPATIRNSTSERQRKSSASTTGASHVKTRVESLIRRQNAELMAMEAELLPPPVRPDSTSHKSIASSTASVTGHGTFFDAQDEDSDEVSGSPVSAHGDNSSRSVPADVHPALRDGLHDFVFTDFEPSPKISLSLPKLPFEDSAESTPADESPVTTPLASPTLDKHEDSPTLPAPGLGLSGMMRHLRQDSDKSSVYPQPSPTLAQAPFTDFRKVSATSTAHTSSLRSDPWELDGPNEQVSSEALHAEPQEPAAAIGVRAQFLKDQAEALQQHQARNKAQRILGENVPDQPSTDSSGRPWQEDMRTFHQRNGSSMTAKSRQDFDEELAERRKRVHQNLKNDIRERGRPTEVEPARQSPDFESASIESRNRRPMQMRQPPDASHDYQSKAMKMLGIQGPPRQRGGPVGTPDDRWREEEERMLRDFGVRPKQRSPPREDEYQGRPPRPPYGHTMRTGSEEELERHRQRSATPNSGRRHRSNSEAAHRSRSRTGQYRDDEERVPSRMAHPQGYGRPHNESHSPPRQRYYRAPSRGPDQRAPYERSGSASSGRFRSNSRAQTPSGYPDRPPPPMMINPGPNQAFGPPRPSPRIPSNQSPVLSSPRPHQSAFDSSSPVASGHNSPTMAHHTVMPAGRTTPTAPSGALGARKKSVSKHMISEPTLMSSTYAVPLVGLPSDPQITPGDEPVMPGLSNNSPPVPSRNPDRQRRPTLTHQPTPPHNPFAFLRADLRPQPASSLPSSPNAHLFQAGQHQAHRAPHLQPSSSTAPQPHSATESTFTFPSGTSTDDTATLGSSAPAGSGAGGAGAGRSHSGFPRARNRLRKVSSEGGSMAGRARRERMHDDLAQSPSVPSFGMPSIVGRPRVGSRAAAPPQQDGAMF